jgi:hypothetical protein
MVTQRLEAGVEEVITRQQNGKRSHGSRYTTIKDIIFFLWPLLGSGLVDMFLQQQISMQQ